MAGSATVHPVAQAPFRQLDEPWWRLPGLLLEDVQQEQYLSISTLFREKRAYRDLVGLGPDLPERAAQVARTSLVETGAGDDAHLTDESRGLLRLESIQFPAHDISAGRCGEEPPLSAVGRRRRGDERASIGHDGGRYARRWSTALAAADTA